MTNRNHTLGRTLPSSERPEAGFTGLSCAKGQTSANAAIVGTGTDGAIDLYNNGTQAVTSWSTSSAPYYAY